MASIDDGRMKCVECLKQLSHQSSIEPDNGVLSEEIGLLQNVYFDELQVTRDEESDGINLLFHITPSTGQDITRKYIYFDLHLHLSTEEYPMVIPKISIPTSRGLSDDNLKSMKARLLLEAEGLIGYPMIYELVEYAKDSLTSNNLPCGECAVCLYQFKDGDVFTKTECFHYFHVGCLSRYYQFFKSQEEDISIHSNRTYQQHKNTSNMLECPVCRDPIAPEAACLEVVLQDTLSHTRVEEEGEGIVISDQVRLWQKEMARLLRRQEERGGVIDTSAKDDVIDETWVRPTPSILGQGGTSSAETSKDNLRTSQIKKKKSPPFLCHGYIHGNHHQRRKGFKEDQEKRRGGKGQRKKTSDKQH